MRSEQQVEHSEPRQTANFPRAEAHEPRYAIYYTPVPEHPLTVAARTWLGRDAFFPGICAADVDEPAFISKPRRYGFHATIKAPFRLKEGASVETLERALRGFAAAMTACPIGPVRVDLLDGFFALVPVQPLPALRGFASRVVTEFDQFRAPMDWDDLRRRMSHRFDETEMTNLITWGYPYVSDRFRFHMTLTNRIPEEQRAGMRARLETIFQPYLSEDYYIDNLSLFVQEHSNADFVVRSQFTLKRGVSLKLAV
ncbi:putative phosphonate metabolism protein [Bradyrhizobium sp. CIR48]|uniref:DUF1045 domain-containing protein n=1 Tax=Bradyrhizobium sp. CIR48 TaxID=2663840 RepID=UPI001606DFF4|nr:DUF1045 domain-containing protein [Bradyrhizobium sp. CIR48]MBB4428312.1 putative phosphonate metabolism protein [Bradyrhizobium sp. CIR48]